VSCPHQVKQNYNRTAVGTIVEEMFGKTSRLKHLRLTIAWMLRAEQEHLLFNMDSCMVNPEQKYSTAPSTMESFGVGIAQFCSKELSENYQQINISFDQEGFLQ
jgi:hypothetical protein